MAKGCVKFISFPPYNAIEFPYRIYIHNVANSDKK